MQELDDVIEVVESLQRTVKALIEQYDHIRKVQRQIIREMDIDPEELASEIRDEY